MQPSRQQQGASPSTPASAPAHSTNPPLTPIPLPTPLEVRQWRRSAQRELRLALTAFKAARDRFGAASALGQQHATQLTNHALSVAYLPALRLGVLSGVQGLKEAAAGKLQLRQGKELVELEGCCQDMAGAVASMEDALAAVRACQQLHQQWQAAVAPFAALTLPIAAAMLGEVLTMYTKELAVKWQLLSSFASMTNQSDDGDDKDEGSAKSAKSGKVDPERLRQRSTVALATWLARPYIEEGRVEELLQLLGDDMAGF